MICYTHVYTEKRRYESNQKSLECWSGGNFSVS